MLFTCSFQTFYKNLHNFWTHNYFHVKFGVLMSKYLCYKPWKFEIRILVFDWVIENSLGGCFFLAHPVYVQSIKSQEIPNRSIWCVTVNACCISHTFDIISRVSSCRYGKYGHRSAQPGRWLDGIQALHGQRPDSTDQISHRMASSLENKCLNAVLQPSMLTLSTDESVSLDVISHVSRA